MDTQTIVCSIYRVLVTNHAYGRPLPRDVILNKASFPVHEGATAKTAFDILSVVTIYHRILLVPRRNGERTYDRNYIVRHRPFILDCGRRGLKLDNSQFKALIQSLHDDCDWDRFELELRIKHFEGWEEIQWKNDQ